MRLKIRKWGEEKKGIYHSNLEDVLTENKIPKRSGNNPNPSRHK